MAIRQSLTAIPERPRCKQSVAQHWSNLNRLNGTRLWPGSMAESSHRMPEGLLLGRLDRGLGLIRRMASCFTDRRDPRLLEHTVETLVGQRVFALAVGYEDLNDHDELRHDPLFHVLAGKLEAKRSDCAPVAGKSTLNRLEHRPRREAGKYPRSITMRRAWKHCSWTSSSMATSKRRRRSCSTRRHRRHDPRRARRSVLPWLLRQLLLPAALHLLRPVPARRQAAPRQHRRGRRRGRRGRPDRRPHPGPAGRRCGSCCAAIRASAARS